MASVFASQCCLADHPPCRGAPGARGGSRPRGLFLNGAGASECAGRSVKNALDRVTPVFICQSQWTPLQIHMAFARVSPGSIPRRLRARAHPRAGYQPRIHGPQYARVLAGSNHTDQHSVGPLAKTADRKPRREADDQTGNFLTQKEFARPPRRSDENSVPSPPDQRREVSHH